MPDFPTYEQQDHVVALPKNKPERRNPLTGNSAVADFIAAISLLAPAGTPPEIVAKLHQEVVRILATPEVKARWKESGYLPREPQSPAQTGAWFSKEIEGWSKFIKEKNIVAE